MWKKFCGICLLVLAVCLLVSVSVVCAQQLSKDEYAQWLEYNRQVKIGKIQVELNTINADLRKKNPNEFKRIDELISQAQAIQKEVEQAQPKAPAKK
jgi:hypothetical protein